MVQYFFCISISSPVLPSLLCSTCLTFLLNIFWAIHQELFSISILKKIAKLKKKTTKSKKKNRRGVGKVVGLQHPDLLKWNPTISVFLGITEIIFSGILFISYIMESLQIIDRFLFEFFDDFSKHDLHIVISAVIKNGKTFHVFCIFLSPWISYALCVY